MKKRFVLAIIITIIILLVGCSIDESEEAKKIKEKAKQIAEEQAKLKEEKYQKAILDLNENITTNNTIKTNLDKRYDILKKQIDKINSGEKELDFASFVRFKIELDFLKVQKYNSKKLQLLSNNFVKAYTKTKEQVKEEDHGSSSLNDRYFSLERKIEKISSGKNELKITEYISIEKELNDLDKDGYIKNRITEQRSKLLKIVITAIESAVVDFDIPEVEEEKEEKETKIEEAKDKAKPQVEIFEEEVDEEGFMVKLINGGFDTNDKRHNNN